MPEAISRSTSEESDIDVTADKLTPEEIEELVGMYPQLAMECLSVAADQPLGLEHQEDVDFALKLFIARRKVESRGLHPSGSGAKSDAA